MWIMGGVFERFPDLKVVFVEPGLGWVSWWLYIVDDIATRQGYEFPGDQKAAERVLPAQRLPDVHRRARRHPPRPRRLGVKNIMWSSDYPHPVSSWPRSQAIAEQVTQGVSDDERELILSGNAARVWNL